MSGVLQIVYGNQNWVPLYMYGTTPAYLTVRDLDDLDQGRCFTAKDVLTGVRVCVIGQTLVRELFDGQSPIDKDIRIQNVAFRVIGVLRAKGANMMGYDQDDILLAPWTAIKKRVTATPLTTTNSTASANSALDQAEKINSLNQLYPTTDYPVELYPQEVPIQVADTPQSTRLLNVDRILVRAANTDDMPEAMQEMTQLLHERHHIRADQPDDFNIRDTTEMTKALASTSYRMATLLLCVAFISLVVGGVGIMNIMLVSVTERTKEIGLRMAVGARARDILRQFLTEAVLLCLLGGAAGILAGRVRLLPGSRTAGLANHFVDPRDRGSRRRVVHRGRRIWLLSRLEGLTVGSHRRAAVRVSGDRGERA